MIVQHNLTSMNANRQLGIVGNHLKKATEKLASGYRVNRAADDAAGLAISEKMRSQVRGLQQASDNAQDGISLIQTAEGAMDQQHAILQRARELVVKASNTAVYNQDDENDDDFQKIQDEIAKLKEEFVRINTDTEFNKKKLLTEDSGFQDGQWLHIGANDSQGIPLIIGANEWTDIDVTDKEAGTNGTIKTVDEMIRLVSTNRSALGAIQNRLEYTIAVDDIAAENLQDAESRIRDTDMADEMTKYAKESILQQAATSMLAQANQANQGVLSLLQ